MKESHEGHGRCTHDNTEWVISLSEDLLIKFLRHASQTAGEQCAYLYMQTL